MNAEKHTEKSLTDIYRRVKKGSKKLCGRFINFRTSHCACFSCFFVIKLTSLWTHFAQRASLFSVRCLDNSCSNLPLPFMLLCPRKHCDEDCNKAPVMLSCNVMSFRVFFALKLKKLWLHRFYIVSVTRNVNLLTDKIAWSFANATN